MQRLNSIKENLIRRLSVNYVSYMGMKECNEQWLDGYHQAKKDSEAFLKQLQMFEHEVPVEK